MKTCIRLFLLITLLSMVMLHRMAEAQRVYQLTVLLKNGARISGKLLHCREDSLRVSNQRDSAFIDLPVSDIRSIRVRGQLGIVKVLTGASVGVAAGSILGMVLRSPSDCQGCYSRGPEESGFVDVAIAGLFIGGITGAIIAESERKFKINGDQMQFAVFRDYVKE